MWLLLSEALVNDGSRLMAVTRLQTELSVRAVRGGLSVATVAALLLTGGCADASGPEDRAQAELSEAEAIEVLKRALRPAPEVHWAGLNERGASPEPEAAPQSPSQPDFSDPDRSRTDSDGTERKVPLLEARSLKVWEIAPDHPMWPVRHYVTAEAELASGNTDSARTLFWELARWGASDPFGDRSGGSSLAVVALWRVVQIDRDRGSLPASLADSLLATADALVGRPLVEGLFRTRLLATLPRLEESLLRSLPHLAVAAGREDEAVDRFLDYQRVTTNGELDVFERRLLTAATRRKSVSRERLDLLRADRLVELRSYEEALALLRSAWSGDDLQIRSRAGLRLASLLRTYPGNSAAFAEADAILDTLVRFSLEPAVSEEALFQRALLAHRRDREAEFLTHLEHVIDRYPEGRRGDDALFQLASVYRVRNPNRALELFEQLREWGGENDWRESAWYFSAISLFGRAGSGDLATADSILTEFLSRFPESELRPHATFWSGRAREAMGDAVGAAERFDTVIALGRYDYYGMRAMMHRARGPEAVEHLWSDPDTRSRLRQAYETIGRTPEAGPATPFHELLNVAIESGLYASLLPLPRVRLEELPIEALAEEGLLPRVAVLLSLRQAALAAGNADSSAANRMRVANVVVRGAKDWSLAAILTNLADSPTFERQEVYAQGGFLRNAYPPEVYHGCFATVGRRRNVSPGLLYSLARHESAYSPTALSAQGALGLFQFMPLTLDSLSRQLDIPALHPDSVLARTFYVFDPCRNSDLWARWFSEQLRPHARRESRSSSLSVQIAIALIEHHAGRPSVREFLEYWKELGSPEDVELIVEVAPLRATRNLLRNVFASLAIVEASGIFEDDGVGPTGWDVPAPSS